MFLEADIYAADEEYTEDDLSSIIMKEGYKIRLLQVFRGKTFENAVIPRELEANVIEWLKLLEKQLKKESLYWAAAVQDIFERNILLDFDTLAQVDLDGLPALGFDSVAAQRKFKNKMLEFQKPQPEVSSQVSSASASQSSISGQSDLASVELAEHKYYKDELLNLAPLFVNGTEVVRNAYRYFTEGFNTSVLNDKEAKDLEHHILDVVVEDIIAEQTKMHLPALYPKFPVLIKAATAIANTLPGLIEQNCIEKNDPPEVKKNKYIFLLANKGGKKKQIRGILYDKFHRKRRTLTEREKRRSLSQAEALQDEALQDEVPGPSEVQENPPLSSRTQRRRSNLEVEVPPKVSFQIFFLQY